MHETVWLVWHGQALVGVFTVQGDAERRASQVRAERSVEREDDPQGWSVRVEPWSIASPTGGPSAVRAREHHLAILERVDREWGLLEMPTMGTAHFFHLDTYLVVPYRNRLTCPAFQFDPWRELWPGFRDVLQVFRDAAWDDVSTALWFVSRQGGTGGDAPAILIRDDPEAVLSAARRVTDHW